MKNFRLSKDIPVYDDFDVVVAGGGPAGCAAAAAAAREGAKTLLIESTGTLGGMGTGGLVPAWCPFSDKEKIIYRGMAETVFNASKRATPHVAPNHLDWVPINPEALKRIFDDLVTGHGGQILFNTMLCGVETDGSGGVTEVIVSNKRGLSAYRAKVYIDCTGDADITAWAGAECEQGAEDTGELMPATLCFVLSNVDEYAFQNDPQNGTINGGLHPHNKNSVIYDIMKDESFPLIEDAHLCSCVIGPGTVGFNAGHLWNVDNTDADGISGAMILGRRIADQFQRALAEYFPSAFASSYLVMTAPLMGIREGRRIIGDYRMSIDDYINRQSFEDEISRNSYYIDIHLSKEESIGDLEKGLGWDSRGIRYEKGESHGIPYRSLVPRDLRNVIVAGRSISCDRRLQGSVRVMPNCLCTGEAAGIAAAYAASGDGNMHNVNVAHLREALRGYGAYIL